jgi:8-oxo-dGTP diphosphatase
MGKIQATCAIITNNKNEFLLIKRKNNPFANHWALISGIGFTKSGQSPEDAVVGEVNSDISSIFQGKKIFTLPVENDEYVSETVVFAGGIDEQKITINEKDILEYKWSSLEEIRSMDKLAYEHNEIIEKYLAN